MVVSPPTLVHTICHLISSSSSQYLNKQAAKIQKTFRGFRDRKGFFEAVERVIRLQSLFRGREARKTTKKNVESVIKIQSFGRMVIAKQQLFRLKLKKNVTKYQAHRTFVVKEILATEETYVKDLENVMRFFYTPLKTLFPDVEPNVTSPTSGKKPVIVPNALTFQDILSVFSNLPDIHEHHLQFLAQLRKLVEGWNETAVIGALFLDLSEWSKIYIIYCNNYDSVAGNMERCKKNDKFRMVVESFGDVKDLKKLTLESMLITPVQRLPRYEMLLRDLLKHTWPEHPDYKNLQKSLDIIRFSVMQINESKRQDSTKKKVAQFQDKFKNPGQLEHVLLKGNFISEGVAKFYDEKDRVVKAYLVLFDEQLVFAKRFSDLKKEEGKLQYRKTLRFGDAKSIYLSQVPTPVEAFDEQLGMPEFLETRWNWHRSKANSQNTLL